MSLYTYKWIYGTSEDDVLSGDLSSRNIMFGWGGSDRLTGNLQADYIFGGDGDNTLEGRGGNDFLFGGKGADKVYGGGWRRYPLLAVCPALSTEIKQV